MRGPRGRGPSWRRLAAPGWGPEQAAAPLHALLRDLGQEPARLRQAPLPALQRRAVVLVDMAGVPVVEVAALEQVPPGTVAARLSRARRVVGDALADVAPATPVSIGPYGNAGRW